MEKIIAFLAVLLWVYIFGIHFRYSWGTRKVFINEDGYVVVTLWGKKVIYYSEISEEREESFWSFDWMIDYMPFQVRTCFMYPTKHVRIVTLKKGFFRHYIFANRGALEIAQPVAGGDGAR